VSYYQKYRPDRLAELDLESVREELKKILGTDRMAHAYLFVGPRGSGKTSAARILARVANCAGSEKKYQEPCCKCEACLSIKKQAAVDVIEIDAASHRGIDDIRDLREKARLAPVSLRRKVYIIDEVHMLTNEAFNALLKTLEEPPVNVMFVLCTTEAHKVPETIVSRCLKVLFSKASPKEVVVSLQKAVKGEKLTVEEGVLERLAGSVDGSFREGHKVLEQLAQTGQKITIAMVEGVLGLVGLNEVGGLYLLVRQGEVKEVMEKMMELERGGVEAVVLVKEILEYCQKEVRNIVGLGKMVGEFEKKMIRGLVSLMVEIKNSPLPFLPLELFLIEMAEEQSGGGEREESRVVKPVVVKMEKVVMKVKRESEAMPIEVDEIKVKRVPCTDMKTVVDSWSKFLANLAPKNHSVAGLLRSAKPKGIEGKCLTIEVFYKFHKEQLEQEVKRAMLEEEAAKLWGVGGIKCVLGERVVVSPSVVKNVENVTGKVDDEEVVRAAEEIFSS
jgi:DNA polymerase III subunit gamma/tau